jgi:hypothetical protein
MVHDAPLSCYWLMLARAPSSPAPSGPASASGRHPCSTRHRCGHVGSRGAHGTAPSVQLLLFPLRPDLRRHARTPHARAGVRVAAARARHATPGRKQGAGRTRGGTARPPRRAEGGGGAGGRMARAARVELSSILGELTARTRGTPAHLRQSFHLPSLHLGWKAAPRRLV